MSRRLWLLGAGFFLLSVLFCPSLVRAASTSDAEQLISLTATTVAKQLSTESAKVHVTKVLLTDSYAIADWTLGQAHGQKIFHKRYMGSWDLIGADSGEATAATLAIYDVPSTTATGLLAAEKNCPSSQKVSVQGKVTLVCFVGPCSAC